MNCNQFRFLIQQRFEYDLPGQDEQMLVSHLRSCRSCAQFEQQLDKLIEQSAELPLPEESVPDNLESLARLIMEQVQPPKSSPLAALSNFIAGLFKKNPDKEAIATHSGSRFPHVKRQDTPGELGQSGSLTKKIDADELDEQNAATRRLKGMATKMANQSGPAEPSGISLGAKFGVATPHAQGQEKVEQSLTMADKIRKKVSDEKQVKEGDLEPAGWSNEPFASPGSWDAYSGAGREPAPAAGNVSPEQEQWSQRAPAGGAWDEPEEEQPAGQPEQTEQVKSVNWDVPAQEFQATGLELQPATHGNLSAAGRSIPADSIIERLSSILGDDPASLEDKKDQGQPSAAKHGLLDLDDKAIDRLFSQNLGLTEQAPVAYQSEAIQEASPAHAPCPVPPAPLVTAVTPSAAATEPRAQEPAPYVPPLHVPPPHVPPPHVPPPHVPPSPEMEAAPAGDEYFPASQIAPAAKSTAGLLHEFDDGAIDRLFADKLGINDEPLKTVAPLVPEPTQEALPAHSAPPPPLVPSWSEPSAPVNLPDSVEDAPDQILPPAIEPAPQSVSSEIPDVAAAASAQSDTEGLFKLDDDAMDRLFADNLGVVGSSMPKSNVSQVNQAVQSIVDAAAIPDPQASPLLEAPGQERPAASAGMPAQLAGLGRLAGGGGRSGSEDSGKIASIGKFLLDQQDLTKISNLTASNLSDSKMRILTLEAAQELQNLLAHIQQQKGVVGSIIVGHDGILIANNMPPELDPESTGVWALGAYLNTDTALKKLGHKHVHQVVCRTLAGYLIIADFGGGILVTLCDGSETEKLIPLMRSITQLVSH